MTYRPSISSRTDERVQKYMIGKTGNKNKLYEKAVRHLFSEDGEMRSRIEVMLEDDASFEEWYVLLKRYCENTDQEPSEVLNQVMSQVINEDGEASIQHKKRLGLE